MKKSFFPKNLLKKLWISIFALVLIGAAWSCKNRTDEESKSVSVKYKVTSENILKLKAVVVQTGTTQNTIYTSDPTNLVTSWESTPQLVNTNVGAVHLAATADGVNATTSKLTVTILIDGKETATYTATGIDLTAKTMVDFAK